MNFSPPDSGGGHLTLLVSGAAYSIQLFRDFVLLTLELATVGLGSHVDRSPSWEFVLCGNIPENVSVDQALKYGGQIN